MRPTIDRNQREIGEGRGFIGIGILIFVQDRMQRPPLKSTCR